MKYPCSRCGREFTRKFSLERHQKTDPECTEKQEIYYCKHECGYSNKDSAKVKRHENRVTPCKKDEITEFKKEIKEEVKKELEAKYSEKFMNLEKKVKQAKRPINYNFIVTNFQDAMNLEDCLNNGNITQEILDNCKKMPIQDGSVYILDSLCNIEPDKRPIHCTDANRLNFVVKSENFWIKDTNAETIKSHMNPVVTSVYDEVHKDKMNESVDNDDIEGRMARMMAMQEITTGNVKRAVNDAIKKSSVNYLTKNMVQETLHHDPVQDI